MNETARSVGPPPTGDVEHGARAIRARIRAQPQDHLGNFIHGPEPLHRARGDHGVHPSAPNRRAPVLNQEPLRCAATTRRYRLPLAGAAAFAARARQLPDPFYANDVTAWNLAPALPFARYARHVLVTVFHQLLRDHNVAGTAVR